MFERPRAGERAILVRIDFDSQDTDDSLTEFRELVTSAQADPVASLVGRRRSPDAKFFVGTGKVEEIRQVIEQHDAEVVLFDHALSPAQERNLERLLKCRVLDRTGLILDIFAQRARTHEGKLQVELAQLQHLSTRLVRGWTHLERQKGGIGLRGPGETQLETDRRLLGDRIKQIKKRLEKVRRQREQGRRSRRRAALPTVSLVGYTNAGKSTLFNQLTDADVYAADKLFATLDPTLRRVDLPDGRPFVLADTVGFIRNLPHDLVEAFRSTLQETRDADLLLHIVDAATVDRDDTIHEVNRVLTDIDARQVPQLEIYNKVDLLPGFTPRIDRDAQGLPVRVWLSAANGQGLDLLLAAMAERLYAEKVRYTVRLPAHSARLRARLYELGTVHTEYTADDGSALVNVEIDRHNWESLCKHDGIDAHIVSDPDAPYLAAGGQAP